MAENKKIMIYFHEESAIDWGVTKKGYNTDIYCISGNTGNTDEDGWYSTDEGFISIEKMQEILNTPIIELVELNGGYLDRDEWIFNSKNKAKIVYEFIMAAFKFIGYELIEKEG